MASGWSTKEHIQSNHSLTISHLCFYPHNIIFISSQYSFKIQSPGSEIMPIVSEDLLRKEYEKNPDIKPSDIHSIRDWLTQQPHLPKDYITDLDLLQAYHCCELNIELTKKVIDLNYTLRSMFTFYQNRSVNNVETALNTWLIAPLHISTHKDYRAIYCKLLDSDPQKFIYEDVVRAFVMIIDLWLSEEGIIPGAVIIVNMDKVSLGHLSRIDLTIAKQFFYFLQEAMFVKLKEFHFVNAPSFMDTLMEMVRPFMKKELLDVIKIHQTNSSTLEEYIPMRTLPREAGGGNKEGSQLKEEIWRKLILNENFFKEESMKRVDENKRPGGPKSISSFFNGLEGSFKRLEID